jgi:hypothetical protein
MNHRTLKYFAAALLADFLVPVLPAQTIKLKVSAEQADIRRRADIGSALVRQVPQGTILESEGKEGEPSSFRSYSFEIIGGGVYMAGGDPNRAARGTADYYQARLGILYHGRVGSAHLGPSAGLSFDYWIRPRIGIGVAVEVVYAGDDGLVTFGSGGREAQLEIVPEIDSVPLRLHLVLSPYPDFVAKAGFEYHFARCRYLYRLSDADTRTEWKGDAKTRGFGLFASLSWERPIFGPVSILVEASGRFARISGFKGTDISKRPDGTSTAEDGTLYFYTGKIDEGDAFPLMFVRERPPSEAGVFNLREARIDLSGISLRTGLKIRF